MKIVPSVAQSTLYSTTGGDQTFWGVIKEGSGLPAPAVIPDATLGVGSGGKNCEFYCFFSFLRQILTV